MKIFIAAFLSNFAPLLTHGFLPLIIQILRVLY